MEFFKYEDEDEDEDEEHFKLCIEKQLLLLLSDDNQKGPDARSHVSKDPLYLFKTVHGSCVCTNSCCSEPRVSKRNGYTKIQTVHQVNKALKQKNGNGTGVFIPQPGHLSRRNQLKQPRSL